MSGERVSMCVTWLLLLNIYERAASVVRIERLKEATRTNGPPNTFPLDTSDKHNELQLQITQVINQVVRFRKTA